MKKILLSTCLASIGLVSARADISWLSTGSIVGPDNNAAPTNFTTPLTGNRFSSTTGFFVQLIYAGANGVADSAVNAGVGVTGDDVVISARWIGAGQTTSPNGRFTAGSPVANPLPPAFQYEAVGNKFFVRAWSAPSSGFNTTVLAASLVPTTSPVYYGNSALYTSLAPDQNNDGLNDTQTFDAGAFVVNVPLGVVPEPTTAALLSMGVAGIGMALKRRRQQS